MCGGGEKRTDLVLGVPMASVLILRGTGSGGSCQVPGVSGDGNLGEVAVPKAAYFLGNHPHP